MTIIDVNSAVTQGRTGRATGAEADLAARRAKLTCATTYQSIVLNTIGPGEYKFLTVHDVLSV